jgi:signal peptidase I
VVRAGWRGRIEAGLKAGVGAFALALLIRAALVEAYWIPSGSMEPTLRPGDRIVAEKVVRWFHSPRPGDIVVFAPPAAAAAGTPALVKRVVAGPGQVVAIERGRVLVDGRPVAEPYVAEAPAYDLPSLRVPEGHLFVLGDNRNRSLDSHVWGFVPVDNVIGRAVFRYWPVDRIGGL